MGDSVQEVTVAKWLKKPGDWVQADEMLVELETDKVSVEVPATHAGILKEITAEEGATISVNSLLAMLEIVDEPAASPNMASSPSEVDLEQPKYARSESLANSDHELTAEEWTEFKALVLQEYISNRLDTPEHHLSFIRDKLSSSLHVGA